MYGEILDIEMYHTEINVRKYIYQIHLEMNENTV